MNNHSTDQSVPADRRNEYLKLLELHNTNRIDYNVRKWETLKFFQSIILAFIGGTIIAITTGLEHELFSKPTILSFPFTAAVFTLPIIAFAASLLAISNLNRESALLFAEEAECFKLAKFLELEPDNELPEGRRWIPGDTHLLMPKWRSWQHGICKPDPEINFDQWVEARTKSHSFRRNSKILFLLEGLIAIALLVALIAIYLGSHCSAF
jgi:hypothetical protein